MKIGLIVPHIFMSDEILPNVLFAPGELSINIANKFQATGNDITLFTPSKVTTKAKNITADMGYFEKELRLRKCTYLDLLAKHPLIFISLARQVQSELIAKAYTMANHGNFDIIHVYTNEEDTAITMSALCNIPIVFTHHDPFNYYVRYKNIFPKYHKLNWISFSYAQRKSMPKDTNWIANIYHGIDLDRYLPNYQHNSNYLLYMGRIIEPKAVHLAIKAIKKYNLGHPNTKLQLKIAGKYYIEKDKPLYWRNIIKPFIDNKYIKYIGLIKDDKTKNEILANAKALIIPSTFEEPFGMVMIESLACGTPLIGLDSGSIPEIIINGVNGIIAKKIYKKSNKNTKTNHQKIINEVRTANNLAIAIDKVNDIDRYKCRLDFENRFTSQRMCDDYLIIYKKVLNRS